jgi:hypothetical protein
MIQNQYLTDLEHAIGQLREQRRNWVKTLAAGAGHEANRAWCEANGDHSQRDWQSAEPW